MGVACIWASGQKFSKVEFPPFPMHRRGTRPSKHSGRGKDFSGDVSRAGAHSFTPRHLYTHRSTSPNSIVFRFGGKKKNLEARALPPDIPGYMTGKDFARLDIPPPREVVSGPSPTEVVMCFPYKRNRIRQGVLGKFSEVHVRPKSSGDNRQGGVYC